MVVRRALALGIIVLISSLGLATSGEAQSSPTDPVIQTQATVQAIDCDTQQVTLAGAGVSSVAQSTLGTVIHVNGDAVPLCGLSPYVGAPATAWVMARGGQVVLVRLDVTSTTVPSYPSGPAPMIPASNPPAPTASNPYQTGQPASVPYPAALPAYTPVPSAAAVVLGTVLVGGLVYLLVRAANGGLYRYPYYGPYVPRYQPQYRPYVGPSAKVPAYNYGPYRRCPDRSWGQWCR
jgi:hypothetical protein